MAIELLTPPTIIEITRKVAAGHLTKRDVAIVEAIWLYGMATTSQIKRLIFLDSHFGNDHSATRVCQRRLRVLVDYHLLDRLQLSLRQPCIYALAETGGRLIQLLREAESLRQVWRPTDPAKAILFADHRLEITEFATQMVEAIRPVAEATFAWQGEQQLRLVKADGTIFRPDGLGRLTMQTGASSMIFFLEWDRGREKIQKAIGQKIKDYLAYRAYPKAWQEQFARFPHLVMVTTGGERRRQNMQAEIERRLLQTGLTHTDFVVLLAKSKDLGQRGVFGPAFYWVGSGRAEPISLLGEHRNNLLGGQ